GLILERLVRHYVAPMAGRVANAEQDGPVLGASALERFVAPRIPIDGIVGVLAQVGTAGGGETIRHSGRWRTVALLPKGHRGGDAPAPPARRFANLVGAAYSAVPTPPLHDRPPAIPRRQRSAISRRALRFLADSQRERPQ